MKLILKKGAVDQSIVIFIQDSSVTTGAGKTGLAYNTASLTCYYVRPGSAAAALTLATQTVTGAHSDGGFVEIDATNMPGFYRLDLSDAILATGVNAVGMLLKGASGMAPLPIEIQLSDFDLNTATPKVDLDTIKTQAVTCAAGVTVLAQVGAAGAPGANNGLVTTNGTKVNQTVDLTAGQSIACSDKTGFALTVTPPTAAEIKTAMEADGSKLDHLWEMTEDDGGTRRLTTNSLEQAPTGGSAPTAAAIADAVWDEAISGHLGAGSTGNALNAAGSAGDPWSTPIPGAYGAGTAGKILGDNVNAPIATIDTVVDAIKSVVDNIHDTDLPAVKTVIDNIHDTDLPAVKAETALIVADTNELQTDLTNGGRLDLLIDGIISTLGLAGAGLTGIPWNAAWDAEVQSECADALNAYDPPTNAEMVARTLLAADYTVVSDLGVVQTGDAYAIVNSVIIGNGAIKTVCDQINVGKGQIYDLIDTEVAAIKSVIDNLHDTDIPAIKTETAAIKAKTDKMTYTSGNDLDVNVQKINDVTLAGDGSGTPMGAA